MACKLCHKTFVSEDDFDTDAKPHVCTICGFSFSLKIQLKRHTQLHANDEPFLCIYCSKDSDKNKSKSYNLRLAKKGDYCCEICDQNFNSKRMLLKHNNEEHKFESSFICDDCDEVFASSSELRKHSLTHKYKTGSRKRSVKKEDPVLAVSKSLECPACFKTFAYQACLDKHVKQSKCRTSENVKPPKRKRASNNDIKSSKLSKPSDEATENNDKKHVCNVCGKSFMRKSALEGHEIIHVKDEFDSADDRDEDFSESENDNFVSEPEPKINIRQSYMCEKCNFVCFSKLNLSKHVERNHGEKKENSRTNKSENVNKGLKSTKSVKEADESKIEKEQGSFQCNSCEKEFKSEKRLKRHMRYHDPILSDIDEVSRQSGLKKKRSKDYICDVCGKRFAGETCLKKHALRHENGSIEVRKGRKKKEKAIDIFTCDFCNEEFVGKKGAYVKHIHAHTPEVCGICDERFVDRQGLREHCKVHVGTEEGRMFMECSQKALDAKNGILPPEPKVEYIYLVLR